MIYRHWPFCNINPDIATILYCTAQHKCNTLQHSRQHNAYAAPNIVAFAPCLLFMNRRHLLLHIQALSRIAPTPRVAHSFSRKKKSEKQTKACSFFFSIYYPFLFSRLLSHTGRTIQPTPIFFRTSPLLSHTQQRRKQNKNVLERLKVLDRASH